MNSLLIHLPPQIWIICLPPSWHDTIVKCEDLTTTVSKIIPDIRPLACSVFTRQSPVCSNASLFANLDFRLNTGEHIHFLFARNVICKSVTICGGEILAPTRYCLVLINVSWRTKSFDQYEIHADARYCSALQNVSHQLCWPDPIEIPGGLLSLTWTDFNPRMDKLLHPF